ncbi:MAG TPA: neutral/alkaline non-lysosomal ceramidase N-terminal domain-containing protein [Candidatus Paceibacterota bacterium]|nr:neutral/alkaline non-lysosomal ceramidase N-terminal domain-containing protein [Verrucomicrobiota bacterium]HSA09901.1 neutral/alkaline non-lysosomal ceramidase N-terminal domain-containing protein [Candidatus Paceibacterota bacterium]
MSELKVGVAEVDFTPPPGLPLLGHIRDDYAARGTHDPLRARAMVVANQAGPRVALLTLDLCMLNRAQARMMREHIAAHTALSPENILIAASHTHGGPAAVSLYQTPAATDAEIEVFLKHAAEAAIRADKNLRTAMVKAGYASESSLSFNRRLRCRDGKTHMNWEELAPGFVLDCLGPIDPRVLVLTVEDGGLPTAGLVNFGLHPAILDYENWLYSADYIGYLDEALRRIVREDFTTLFFNGCCANVNHINYADPASPRRGYPTAQRVGYVLAAAVAQALRARVPVAGDAILASRESVELERFKIPDNLFAEAKRFLETGRQSKPAGMDGLDFKSGAPLWVRMREQQATPDRVEVMALRIGPVGIVGMPGEVFCETGLAIQQASPAEHTIVIELANDAVGYLPTREAYVQGGYEVTPGATAYAPGCAEKLAESAIRQLKRLFECPGG